MLAGMPATPRSAAGPEAPCVAFWDKPLPTLFEELRATDTGLTSGEATERYRRQPLL